MRDLTGGELIEKRGIRLTRVVLRLRWSHDPRLLRWGLQGGCLKNRGGAE